MEYRQLHGPGCALAERESYEVLELLADDSPGGVPAGIIAGSLDLATSDISRRLVELFHAGLVECEIRGDRVRYRADQRRLAELAPEFFANCGEPTAHGLVGVCV